jgi:hypothetical protein
LPLVVITPALGMAQSLLVTKYRIVRVLEGRVEPAALDQTTTATPRQRWEGRSPDER